MWKLELGFVFTSMRPRAISRQISFTYTSTGVYLETFNLFSPKEVVLFSEVSRVAGESPRKA